MRVLPLFILIVILANAMMAEAGPLEQLADQARAFLAPELPGDDPLATEALQGLARETDSILGHLQLNGLFDDVDVTTLDVWARDLQKHAERLLVLARAHQTPAQEYYHSPEVLDAFERATVALESLLRPGMPRPGNWWNWEIGLPKAYGPALFLMTAHLDSGLLSEARESLAYLIKDEPSSWSRTGQNLIWVSFTRLYLGLLNEDSDLIDWAAEQIASVCTVTTGEGIQPDGSFHQHGPSIQTGAYGAGVARDVGVFAYFARSTPWALDEEAISVWLGYLRAGSRWSIYRNYYEPSARGREIVRADTLGHDGAFQALLLGASLETDPHRPLAASALHTMETWAKGIDPSYAMLAAGVEAMEVAPAGPVGVRAYPRSDYLLQRNRDWLLSLKMLSDRTLAAERYNDEGKQSRHLSSGVTWLMKTGNEWDQKGVRASLDWARLPGTTTEIGLDLSKAYPNGSCYGRRSFVGGLDDGPGGVAAMDWLAREYLGDSHLMARKSWFFWEGGHVAIGSEITSTSGLPVETTVAQWPLSSVATPVRVNGSGQPGGGWSESVAGPALVEADGIGYWIPVHETVRLSRAYQSGRFGDITRSGDTLHTNLFLNLSFEHGTTPVAEDYAYAVMPLYPEGGSEEDFVILSRDNVVHAVRFPEDKRLSAVFWESGQVEYLAARQRMLVTAREPEPGKLRLTVSGASHGEGYLEILLAGRVDPGNLPGGVKIREMSSPETPATLLRFHVADGEETRLDLLVEQLSDFSEIPPLLTGSSAGSSSGSIRLHFTREVDPAEAADPSRYRLFPAAVIERAEPSPDGRSVELFLSGTLNGLTYRAFARDLAARGDEESIAPLSWCDFSVQGAVSSTNSLLPMADAHVRDGTYAGDNFGNAGNLYVKRDGQSYQREAFLRFDLEGISEPVHAAALELTVESMGPIDWRDHEVFTTTEDWEESAVTWTTRPAAVAYHARYRLSGDALGVRIDVTESVNGHLGEKLTFVIRAADDYGPDGWTAYASRESESPGNRPRLILNTKSSMDSWLQAFFGDSPPAHDEDSDGDGLPNLVEYALGRSPVDPRSGGLFQTRVAAESPATLFLPHPDSAMPGTELFIEYSPDLVHWEPANGSSVEHQGLNGTLLDKNPPEGGFFRVIAGPED